MQSGEKADNHDSLYPRRGACTGGDLETCHKELGAGETRGWGWGEGVLQEDSPNFSSGDG